jgi:hypothetical protein
MALDRPLEQYSRVQIWLRDYEESWGSANANTEEQLRALELFCVYVGKDPDTICSECLRALDEGGEKIRYKARHYYIAQIEAFESTPEGSRRAANAVRSFLIHNGIAMGGRASW